MAIADKIKYIQELNSKPIDLTLERIAMVAKKLQLLAFDCPIITVGGTNGKGSTVATLERIYHHAGYKTGVFTSPQITHHTELIRLNRKAITSQQLETALERLDTARDGILLTEFEFMTLAALLLFKQASPDIIILEVGLGGRDDAVNIIDADLSIITNVALDHCQWLGNDRNSIAYIKSGIMRKNKTTIIGERDAPCVLLDRAQQLCIDSKQLGKEFYYEINPTTWTWKSKEQTLRCLPLPNLLIENVACAIMAAEILMARLPINTLENILKDILPKLSLPGRLQIFDTPCRQIFDAAHNPAAAIKLAETLGNMKIPGKIYAIFSMFADKDINNTIKPFKGLIHEWHIAALPHIRAASCSQLHQALENNDINVITEYQDIEIAYQAVLNKIQQNDAMLIFGSFQVLNAILPQST